ncbi:hypothetical protein AB0J83_46810 [Actinoplanes sp. NPDC049596]|uniref:hypothetical protein n=1 Tax=unclassified Actinoplanes TaxID=2626549 RepID=UPI003430FFF2
MRFLDRPALIVAGWTAAAILAVLVGVVGIGLVGSGLTSDRAATVLDEDDVVRALGSAPTPSSGSTRSAAPATGGQTFTTRGGTVVADCAGIISMAPAQGFTVHDQDAREGEFRHGRDRIEVEVRCENGTPRLDVTNDD